jgi:hypothetical protein
MRIPAGQAKCGQTLAADVTDRGGRVLLRQGLELTDKHLRILQMWGITEVTVGSAAAATSAAESEVVPDATRLAAVQGAVDGLFRHTNAEQPLVAHLRGLAATRLASDLPEKR